MKDYEGMNGVPTDISLATEPGQGRDGALPRNAQVYFVAVAITAGIFGLAHALTPAYAVLAAEVVVPLRFQDALEALLVLGPKRSEAAYTDDDLELLETVADQAAVAVANAEAHRRVLDYARELERSLMIRTNLAKFVPQRVRQLIEESPEAPSLDKRETDVTVLFADITGYTRLTARLAPDDLDALVERYFGAFLDEIVKHGGDVNETAGDGLMVIFQRSNRAAPGRPDEDHALNATRAAFVIQARTLELNEEYAGVFPAIELHMGINTGLALLGATKLGGAGSQRWTFTATGPTTNLAARFAGSAEGGDIVVGPVTAERIRTRFVLEALGEKSFKNVSQPLAVYRVIPPGIYSGVRI